MDSRSCTTSPTQDPVALETPHNPASEPSNSSQPMSMDLTSSQSKVSSTIQQSPPSGRYLVATSHQQAALPPSTSEEAATNRVEEEAAACQGEVEEQVGDCNQDLSKFDEVAASESLLMLSGGGGAGKFVSLFTFTSRLFSGGGAGEKAGSGMQEPEVAAFSLPVMCPCQVVDL